MRRACADQWDCLHLHRDGHELRWSQCRFGSITISQAFERRDVGTGQRRRGRPRPVGSGPVRGHHQQRCRRGPWWLWLLGPGFGRGDHRQSRVPLPGVRAACRWRDPACPLRSDCDAAVTFLCQAARNGSPRLPERCERLRRTRQPEPVAGRVPRQRRRPLPQHAADLPVHAACRRDSTDVPGDGHRDVGRADQQGGTPITGTRQRRGMPRSAARRSRRARRAGHPREGPARSQARSASSTTSMSSPAMPRAPPARRGESWPPRGPCPAPLDRGRLRDSRWGQRELDSGC